MLKNEKIVFRICATLAFVALTLFAVWQHHPGFEDHFKVHNDVRQSMNWQNYYNGGVFDGDLLRDYSQVNSSPTMNTLHKISSHFTDVVFASKVFAVLFFALAGLVFFYAGYSQFGLPSAVLCTGLFALVYTLFKYYSGGFSAGAIMPLTALTLVFMRQQRWRAFLILLPCAALTYPTAAVLASAILCVDILIFEHRRLLDPVFWKNKGAWLAPAGLLTLAALVVTYVVTPDWYGHLVTRSEIADRVVFTEQGRYPIISDHNFLSELWSRLDSPFLAGSLIFFLVFSRRWEWLPSRQLCSLFVACCVCYLVAEWQLMSLYIPNRYTRYGLFVFVILYLGWQYGRMISTSLPSNVDTFLAVTVILGVALVVESPNLKPGRYLMTVKPQYLYEKVADLPRSSLIAAPPYIANNIPLYSHRRVLFNHELAHPYVSNYWVLINERIQDFFQAYFSDNAETVSLISEKYGISHWLIDTKDFSKARLHSAKYLFEPYNSQLKKELNGREKFFLMHYCNSGDSRILDRYCIVDVSKIRPQP